MKYVQCLLQLPGTYNEPSTNSPSVVSLHIIRISLSPLVHLKVYFLSYCPYLQDNSKAIAMGNRFEWEVFD